MGFGHSSALSLPCTCCGFGRGTKLKAAFASATTMTDRYFKNDLPDHDAGTHDSARFPSPQDHLAAALNLKNEIVQATFPGRHGRVQDLTVYTGVLGTAFLCFRSYERTGSEKDLVQCLEIVRSHTHEALTSMKPYFTFLCGRAGNLALGAVAARYHGDVSEKTKYVQLLKQMAKERQLMEGLPDELLYGRTGFLWACLFVNKHVGEDTVPWSLLEPIVCAVMASGRAGRHRHGRSPLMYEWHDTKYWGAAHGLAGIMHVLLHFPLSREDADDVKGTLRYMVENHFPSGNYPAAEGDTKDVLVHWCHGAPGVALTLCKAAQVFHEPWLKEAALDAGEVVWKRGLLRRLGICHGVCGNTYTFLALYRLTKDPRHLHRAKAFSSFLYEHGHRLVSSGRMHGGDHPYSLFEGAAGPACLWLDMVRPEDVRFPAYEL